MRLGIFLTILLMVVITPAYAQLDVPGTDLSKTSTWLRFPAISPDGETLSFTYRGRIFIVDAEGGLAAPVTASGFYSYGATWSPDSQHLAFASNLNGDDDVYIADFSGKLERMTWSSASEVPTSFSPDGQRILYAATRLGDAERSVQGALSGKPQLYAVDTNSGREVLILPNLAAQAQWNNDQSKLVYSYNPSEDPEDRQHRVQANARQLWTYDPATGRHQRIFETDGVDRHQPVWSADGATLYYLSEASGWLNVWMLDLDSGTETQLTRFEGDPVRDLSVSDTGTIAFANRGRVFVMPPGVVEPEAIEILILEQRADMQSNHRVTRTQSLASSPNGELFALVANADVFVQDSAGTFRQVTATPGEEKDIVFSPDSSMLAYAAFRGHQWGIYGVELHIDAEMNTLAANFDEVPLYVPNEGNAYQPVFSPDGTKLAFVADRREIQVLDIESGDVIQLFETEDYNSVYKDGDMAFSWSPNSKDLLVQWRSMGGTESRRIAIVSADGTTPPSPIGNIPDMFDGIWSANGNQIIGYTSLYSARSAQLHAQGVDLYRIFLNEKARQDFLDIVDGTDTGFDRDESDNPVFRRYELPDFRSHRLEGRLTYDAQNSILLRALGDQISLLTVVAIDENILSFEVVSLADGRIENIGNIDAPGWQAVSYVPELNVVDVKIQDTILRVPINSPEQISEINSTLFFLRDDDAARLAAFEQAWADVKYRYYDSAHEGRDWDAIGAKYRVYLDSIASDRELKELISAMYGELSASHLFTEYAGMEALRWDLGNTNDSLGAYIDYSYDGVGRRVAAILPGGPLDRHHIDVEAGDIITSINSVEVPNAGGIEKLLSLNVGRPAVVGVIDGETGEERLYTIKPIDQLEEASLAKARIIDARREMVENLSRSCIAYQYVPAMDNDAYLHLLGTLNAKRGIAKAALIDVRSNKGGNLTRELITLLDGEAYATLGTETGPVDVEPNNRWVWPSAVVVDSFGYSDGSVFPQAYQDNAIGLLVGDTVLNTGTAVDFIESSVVPGLVYGIPVLPNRRINGTFYENSVVHPEIHVPFDPNAVGLHSDPQLDAAISALMEQIGIDANCRLPLS